MAQDTHDLMLENDKAKEYLRDWKKHYNMIKDENEYLRSKME